MAKKKAAEPTVETPTGEAPIKRMTQREAVRMALAAKKELPVDGVPYVREKFGITLTNQAFSTVKSKINTAGKKKARTKAPLAVPAAARSTAPAKSSLGVAGQVEAIKSLCEQLGADQVISIAKLFVK